MPTPEPTSEPTSEDAAGPVLQDPQDLDGFAAYTRRAMDHDRACGRDWTPRTWKLITRLTDRVAAELAPAGHPRRLAECAVDHWILLQKPLAECMAYQLEHRDFELPRPGRGQQGFAPRPAPGN